MGALGGGKGATKKQSANALSRADVLVGAKWVIKYVRVLKTVGLVYRCGCRNTSGHVSGHVHRPV